MSKQEEVILDDLPKPGEPLTPAIAEENRVLLEEDLLDRKQRMAAKLTPRQERRLRRRYKTLWKKLNEAEYNVLIQQRWNLHNRYEKMKHDWSTARADKKPRRHITAAAKEVAAVGREVNAEIAKIQPLADEFEDVRRRLADHDAAVRWEREDAENHKVFMREARTWEQQIKATFRRSARLHHKGEDRNKKTFIKIPQIQRTIFKEDRVYYQIKTTGQNPFLRLIGRWRDYLPYNVDIRDLSCDETLENLSAACDRVVKVERGKRGQNFFYVISRPDSPDGIPKRVLYSKVLQWYPTKDHAKTPWAAGVTDNRVVEWYNFEDSPHLLIIGTTQSGKSNHVNQMISTLVTMNSPDEVRALLIDNKGGIEFTHWQGIQHAIRPIIKTVSEVLPALHFLRGVMEARMIIWEKLKTKSLYEYNSKVKPEDKLPRIIVFIDEMATLLGLGDLSKEIQQQLGVIASQARVVGIHLVVCTQHMSVDVLPGWALTNLNMRISGKLPGIHASINMLGTMSAANLPNIAGRMVFSHGRFEVIAQSPYISNEEIARAVKISQEYGAPDNTEFEAPEKLIPREKFPRHDMLDIVINRLALKLSPTRIHDIVGNDVAPLRKIKLMVEDVIEEEQRNGQIEHDGNSYRIKKEGKSHLLIPIERAIEPEMPESDDEESASHRSIELATIE